MSEHSKVNRQSPVAADILAVHAEKIMQAMERSDYETTYALIEEDIVGTWFGLNPSITSEIIRTLAKKLPGRKMTMMSFMRALSPGESLAIDDVNSLVRYDFDDEATSLSMAMMRMSSYRLRGHVPAAKEQLEMLEQRLAPQIMQPLMTAYSSIEIQFSVQMGITAMLTGEFTKALTYFTRAQLQAPVMKYVFLFRDAMIKSAIIHAAFGNKSTARSFLKRSKQVPRTSTWVERHLDIHAELARILMTFEDNPDCLKELDALELQEVGEMWPFYILATYRILDHTGEHDELDHRLEMFEQMPFAKIEGQGLQGSIIPLKHAIAALRTGRVADAQAYLDYTDQSVPYVQVFQAAAHLYSGRTQQAIHEATHLYPLTRGFRRLEASRLAVLAAAQYQAENQKECIETLNRAARLVDESHPELALLFSPETRELAVQHIATWPQAQHAPSMFLTGLPRPGLSLTDRETEIVRQLAKGLTRAELAKDMFISVNTLKTHLQSIYRKFDVSTASDAVLSAQRRGLL